MPDITTKGQIVLTIAVLLFLLGIFLSEIKVTEDSILVPYSGWSSRLGYPGSDIGTTTYYKEKYYKVIDRDGEF